MSDKSLLRMSVPDQWLGQGCAEVRSSLAGRIGPRDRARQRLRLSGPLWLVVSDQGLRRVKVACRQARRSRLEQGWYKMGFWKSGVRSRSKVTGWDGEGVVRSGRLGWSEVEKWRWCEVALGGAGVRLGVCYRNFRYRPPSTDGAVSLLSQHLKH